jgi:hypothetical protein
MQLPCYPRPRHNHVAKIVSVGSSDLRVDLGRPPFAIVSELKVGRTFNEPLF